MDSVGFNPTAERVYARINGDPDEFISRLEGRIGESLNLSESGQSGINLLGKNVHDFIQSVQLFSDASKADEIVRRSPDFLSRRDLNGNTFLHHAISTPTYGEPFPTQSIVENILRKGADVKKVNVKGETPLLMAVNQVLAIEETYPTLLKACLEKDYDFNQVDRKGRSLLHHLAMLERETDMPLENRVADLLQRVPGLKVDEPDFFGMTPLGYAIWAKEGAVIDTLVQAGADPQKLLSLDIVKVMKEIKASEPKKGWAAMLPEKVEVNVELIKQELDERSSSEKIGYLFDIIEELEQYPTVDDVIVKLRPILQGLFDGGKVNLLEDKDDDGNGWLHVAAVFGDLSLFYKAKELGMDLNSTGSVTPFMMAMATGNRTVCDFLLDQGITLQSIEKDALGRDLSFALTACRNCDDDYIIGKVIDTMGVKPDEIFTDTILSNDYEDVVEATAKPLMEWAKEVGLPPVVALLQRGGRL